MISDGAQRLAIVGAGPMCVYALERLAAHIAYSGQPAAPLSIAIFERSGNFGDGEVNSRAQPASSLMNRISAQVGFAADESHLPDLPVLPKHLRPSLYEWLQQCLDGSAEPHHGLSPGAIPPRRLHGAALADQFQKYVAMLRSAGVRVELHAAEVFDVHAEGGDTAPVELHTTGTDLGTVTVDRVLFVTGNASSFARPNQKGRRPARTPYIISFAYPLDGQLTLESVPPGEPIGLAGLGLTAIDAVLHLTEGRGGRFERVADPSKPIPQFRYVACSLEPSLIVAFSPSGVLPCSRPENRKLTDPCLTYKGRYFTKDAIKRLRHSRGRPAAVPNGVNQLDFDADVLPIVVLELANAYYTALFGAEFCEVMAQTVGERYRTFLNDCEATGTTAIEFLLKPIESCFDQAVACVEGRGVTHLGPLTQVSIADEFRSVVYGHASPSRGAYVRPEEGETHSPWDHPTDPRAHRLDWKRLLYPLTPTHRIQPQEWVEHLKAFMVRDLMDSKQDNLHNPVKVACDGVFRDLRFVFCEVVDRGGLTPQSHEAFLTSFMRCYNRLSNGAGVEPTAKMLALIEHGLLDVATGPDPSVGQGRERFRVRGTWTGSDREVSRIIKAHLGSFDAANPEDPLYSNLLQRGLVRRWANPGAATKTFLPGGLDLSDNNHPINRSGIEDRRLTFLGTPAEGMRIFQSAAARPNCRSDVFRSLSLWAESCLRTSIPMISS